MTEVKYNIYKIFSFKISIQRSYLQKDNVKKKYVDLISRSQTWTFESTIQKLECWVCSWLILSMACSKMWYQSLFCNNWPWKSSDIPRVKKYTLLSKMIYVFVKVPREMYIFFACLMIYKSVQKVLFKLPYEFSKGMI